MSRGSYDSFHCVKLIHREIELHHSQGLYLSVWVATHFDATHFFQLQ